MQAFIDGKIIEVLDTELDIWLEIDNPIFDFIHNKYRIKPEKKFKPKKLQPFDKVLVQEFGKWTIDFFAYFNPNSETPYYCIGHFADIILPYNDNTKHLVGTNIAAPDYYKFT